jgi:BNR repeat-like domain
MISLDLRQLPTSRETVICRDQGYFPVLINPKGDEILAVLRGGSGHVGIHGRLDVVHSPDAGNTWQSPQTIVDSEWDDRNPAVGVAPDGSLLLAYHAQGSYDESGNYVGSLGRALARHTRSVDNGITWEAPQDLAYKPLASHSSYGHIVTLPDGRLLMPIYGSNAGASKSTRDHSFLLSSSDNGRTWDDPMLIAQGYNETALLPLPNGDLLAALRSDDRGQLLAVCRSADAGRSWSRPIQITNELEHPADLLQLANGWVLLIFGVRHEPLGVQAMISRNNGHTFDVRRLLVSDGLPGPDLGYPSAVKVGDRIVIGYYTAARHEWQASDSPLGCQARALSVSERELVRACGD